MTLELKVNNQLPVLGGITVEMDVMVDVTPGETPADGMLDATIVMVGEILGVTAVMLDATLDETPVMRDVTLGETPVMLDEM